MGKRALLALLFFCLLSGWGLAQDQGQDQDQGPSSGDTGQSGQFGATLFLSGKVVLDDGQPAAESTQVELICQGTPIQQVYASSGGLFSFQIDLGGAGQHSRLPLDASVSSGTRMDPYGSGFNYFGPDLGSTTETVNLSACELQAKLGGFRSEKIRLGFRRVLDNPDVGVLVLHNSAGAETAAISETTLAAPKDAMRAYENALKELGKKNVNFAKTSNELEKAVKIYPEFAAAWYLLGEIRLELQDRTAAREAFEQAIAVDSQYANSYVSLAMLEIDQGRWEEAARFSGQALELDSKLVRAHYFHALANVSLGRLDVAEESVIQVQESSSAIEYPLTHYMLGWIVSQKGDFLAAAAEYRRFLEIEPTSPVGAMLEAQLASWTADGLIPTLETSEKQD